MSNLPVDPAVLIASATALVAVILYLREYNRRKKYESQFEKKGWEILHQSIKKSQAVLGEAELEGVKIEAEYARQLRIMLDQSQQTITAAQNQLLQFMQDLQKRSEEFEQAGKTSGEQRINQLFERVENRLSDFLVQTAQKTSSSIELELKSARQLIDAYKNEQIKLIDENIIAMMEQTLNIVLGKKLSLKDQLELVYEALERAKIDKFVI